MIRCPDCGGVDRCTFIDSGRRYSMGESRHLAYTLALELATRPHREPDLMSWRSAERVLARGTPEPTLATVDARPRPGLGLTHDEPDDMIDDAMAYPRLPEDLLCPTC